MASNALHAIIGTAGHIDHGKTALIRALTGQETDRLKEEKERGISIDLGFAYLTLPDDTRAGIIDVPGHERFIRNMLAGAHGIDLVLFTIAADDGVMPQSEEHLDILHLLGTRRGIFAITKADLADDARLAQVREEIELLADGTRLAGAPIVVVSSTTGAGIEELRAEIVRQLDGFEARRATGIFRLPLDRAFSIKGHGIVVTGTAMGADVHVGQKLRVLPRGEEVRVRSIEVHSQPVEIAGRCQRVALNLTGADRMDLARGDVLADDRLDFATARFDAWIELRPAARRALKNNSRVRLFIAASETIARAIVLEPAGAIEPKSGGCVQLVCDEPIVALGGDRFVLRDETNSRTIGGGIVLNARGRASRRPVDHYRAALNRIHRHLADEPNLPDALEALVDLQAEFALPAHRIATLMNIPSREAETALKDPRFVKLSLGDEEGFSTARKWAEVKSAATAAIAAHHAREPLSPGPEIEAVRSQIRFEIAPRGFRSVVDRLVRETEIVREDGYLRLKSHRVELGTGAGELGGRVTAALDAAVFQPPDLRQLSAALGPEAADLGRLRSVLGVLEREGRVVKIATDFYFSRAAVDSAREKLVAYLAAHPEITAAEYRDLIDASRKFSIALLDYFDRSGVTVRAGDVRKLRARAG
jgi:selenocysteine-specific elongation factor